MAKLSKRAKEELQAICEEEFKVHLTDGEVEEMGARLLRLFSILLPNADSDTPEDQ